MLQMLMFFIAAVIGQEYGVVENLHGGHVLRLEDGSYWEVLPSDVQYTQLWIVPAKIRLGHGQNTYYPNTMKNIASKTTISVRAIDSPSPKDLPAPPPPNPYTHQHPTPQPQKTY